MGFLFTQLGRYLFMRTLSGIGVALGAVLAAILLVDVVEQLRTIGNAADLSLWQALGLTALKAPQLMEETLPFVVLAGAMIGLIQLNRRSELIALRASGVSAWRFLAPTAVAALLIGIGSTTVLNPIGALLYERYENARARLSGGSEASVLTRNGIWLRQGDGAQQTVIHAEGLAPNSTVLTDATFFTFQVAENGALQFLNRIRAAEAELRPSEMWELRNYTETSARGSPHSDAVLSLPTTLEASALLDTFIAPGTLSFWELPEVIARTRASGLAPVRYELQFHSLIALPLLLAAMATLGAVFSLRLQRLGGMAGYIGGGIAIGFLVYFSGQVAAAFAITEVVPPIVSAWSPALTGLFAAMSILSFIEDG
jgi:lipopolysaccharide export system permease protein